MAVVRHRDWGRHIVRYAPAVYAVDQGARYAYQQLQRYRQELQRAQQVQRYRNKPYKERKDREDAKESAPMAGGVLTNQYDARTTYRRKRGNPRRRRRWVRFSRKVKAVTRDDLPTQVVFRTTSVGVSTVAIANSQNHISFALYGSDAGTIGWDDVQAIFADAVNVAPAGTTQANLELFWKTATIDISFRNTSVANTAKIDLYTVKFKDDVDATSYSSLSNIFSNTITSYPTMSGTTTAVNAAIRGVTPFMAPMFGSMCTVTSIKSFLLGVGECGTFKYTDKKHYTMTGEVTDSMMALRKYTTGFLLIVYPADATSTGVTSINVTAERKYFFVNQFADKVTISQT